MFKAIPGVKNFASINHSKNTKCYKERAVCKGCKKKFTVNSQAGYHAKYYCEDCYRANFPDETPKEN